MSTLDPTLEREYNNRLLVPEHPAIFAGWRNASEKFRSLSDADFDLHYGTAERHRMDLFHAPHAHGTVVFIHGGYWRSLDKSDFSFVAAPFIANGLSVVLINYRLCPSVGLADIVADCRAAFAWLQNNGTRLGTPVNRVALVGHSAGGHLVSMLFATDWLARGIDPSCIRGGVALSGLFDLAPLLNCSMNDDLRLDATTARTNSTIHHQCQIAAPLYLAVGADESAAFRGQTRDLHRTWPETCRMVEEISGFNHFTIVDDFVRPESHGFQFVRRLFASAL